MANANVINEKAAVVAALVERLNGAQSGVFVDYSGLTVAEDTEMRSAMRKEDIDTCGDRCSNRTFMELKLRQSLQKLLFLLF